MSLRLLNSDSSMLNEDWGHLQTLWDLTTRGRPDRAERSLCAVLFLQTGCCHQRQATDQPSPVGRSFRREGNPTSEKTLAAGTGHLTSAQRGQCRA